MKGKCKSCGFREKLILMYFVLCLVLVGVGWYAAEGLEDLEVEYDALVDSRALECLQRGVLINISDCDDTLVSVNSSRGDGVNLDEILFIKTLNDKFAGNHEYVNGSYNCRNYSRDYVLVMRSLGYDVQIVAGRAPSNKKGHAWVRVGLDVDPQTGDFVDYSSVYPIGYSEKYMKRINEGE